MYPILYIISPPRARSTILFRALQAQIPNATCFHEPSQAVHDREKGVTYAADWWRKDAYTSYEQIQHSILEASNHGPVIVKEMSFACGNSLDQKYLSHPYHRFFFLIRDPLKSIFSFYRQVKDKLMPEIFSNDIGFENLYQLYHRVQMYAVHPPMIIDNTAFKNPYSLFQQIYSHSNLDIIPTLSWNSLPSNFDGDSWHEQKKEELTQFWHGPAIESTHIEYVDPPIFTVDDLLSKVEEFHFDVIKDAYEKNQPYYELFLKDIQEEKS